MELQWNKVIDHVVWDSNNFDLPGVVWDRIEPFEGTMPHLKAHAAIKVSESLIFIFGGYDQKGECTDTSILFDVGNKQKKLR